MPYGGRTGGGNYNRRRNDHNGANNRKYEDTLRNLIVSFLPPGADSNTVSEVFSKCGQLESIKMLGGKGSASMLAFVKYFLADDAAKAIEELHGRADLFNGIGDSAQPIAVAYAKNPKATPAAANLPPPGTHQQQHQQQPLGGTSYAPGNRNNNAAPASIPQPVMNSGGFNSMAMPTAPQFQLPAGATFVTVLPDQLSGGPREQQRPPLMTNFAVMPSAIDLTTQQQIQQQHMFNVLPVPPGHRVSLQSDASTSAGLPLSISGQQSRSNSFQQQQQQRNVDNSAKRSSILSVDSSQGPCGGGSMQQPFAQDSLLCLSGSLPSQRTAPANIEQWIQQVPVPQSVDAQQQQQQIWSYSQYGSTYWAPAGVNSTQPPMPVGHRCSLVPSDEQTVATTAHDPRLSRDSVPSVRSASQQFFDPSGAPNVANPMQVMLPANQQVSFQTGPQQRGGVIRETSTASRLRQRSQMGLGGFAVPGQQTGQQSYVVTGSDMAEEERRLSAGSVQTAAEAVIVPSVSDVQQLNFDSELKTTNISGPQPSYGGSSVFRQAQQQQQQQQQ